MNGLSLDYARLMHSLRSPLDPTILGAALLEVLADLYEAEHPGCALHQFEQSAATHLFDLAGSADLPQEDRTIAAWALTPRVVDQRDTVYQRGFPMAPGADDAPVDGGHLIPHFSGGEFGPDIFRQDRALNRGWSDQGRKYRALEREAADIPGTFHFGHLLYSDDSAYPSEIGIGLLRGATLHVQRFDNRP
jgi:hypothetical protein